METYKPTAYGMLIRQSDGVEIPPDPSNKDYQRYLADVATGAEVLPADPAPIIYDGQRSLTARLRTTDATPAELYRAPLEPLTGYVALASLIGVDAGNGAIRVIRASIVAKRLGAGALLVGAPVVIASHADAAASAWTITASVSGNDFVIACTGAAGRSVDWLMRLAVQTFTPGGQP